MKKIFLCLALLALLGSDLAYARGGRGGGGRGGRSSARGTRGARGGRGGRVRRDGRSRRHSGRHYRRDRYHHHRHYHRGHWYDYSSGWYLYAGLWYPWWYWPYRTETDVVIWQETVPENAKYANEDELDDLEEQNYQLRQRQADLDARMRALEKK